MTNQIPIPKIPNKQSVIKALGIDWTLGFGHGGFWLTLDKIPLGTIVNCSLIIVFKDRDPTVSGGC